MVTLGGPSRRMNTVLLACGVLLSGCAPAGEAGPARWRDAFAPSSDIDVTIEVAAFRDERGEPILHISGCFPRYRLLFQREEREGGTSVWAASYSWRAVIRDREERQVGGGTYAGRVALPEGARREDPAPRVRISGRFPLPEGRWSVEVAVEDERSIRRGEAEARAEAPSGADGAPGVSDIELLGPGGPDRSGGEVLVGGRVRWDAECLRFRYETYALETAGSITYTVRGGSGERTRLGEREGVPGRRVAVTDSVNIRALDPGSWTLGVEVEVPGGVLGSRRPFWIQRRLLETGAARDPAARQLRLYASGQSVERFEGMEDPQERVAFVDSLWSVLDPTPGTPRNEAQEEFVRRLEHAEERWGERTQPGWDTDPGRVFVAYGAPVEELEDRAVIAPRGPLDQPREVTIRRWVYRDPPVVFVFQLEEDGRWVLRRDLSTGPPPAAGNE